MVTKKISLIDLATTLAELKKIELENTEYSDNAKEAFKQIEEKSDSWACKSCEATAPHVVVEGHTFLLVCAECLSKKVKLNNYSEYKKSKTLN